MKKLALKPSELKPLDRAALLLLCARCALRVTPWIPRAHAAKAKAELARVVADAFAAPAKDATQRARALAEAGARTQNAAQREGRDEELARCHGYALSALAEAVAATALADRADVVKGTIMCAKLAASLPAILAHAGRVTDAPARKDPVDYASGFTWASIRVDVKAVAFACTAVERLPQSKRMRLLLDLAPLWPARTPSFATPPSKTG